ncbi:MAG TPA: glycosyltransferase 61 family protein [Acetobacteraceae bacterium]
MNRHAGPPAWGRGPDGGFARQVEHPALWLARLDDVQYWPFAPPFLPRSRELISDFLVPWGPQAVGWFEYGNGVYQLPFDLIDTATIDTAFYMGHPISGHFGHFIADCLSRMHAWRICRELFGTVKVVLEHLDKDSGFRTRLLTAAGVPAEDIVFLRAPIHCRRLLLGLPALGVERYASPVSARLWRQVRDAFGGLPPGRSERVYLSRASQSIRKLTNEAEVEDLFLRFGFAIIRPEELSIEQQIALVSNAVLIAGPGGSAMFNLAFQKRLKSVLLLIPETFTQITEWLFLAEVTCTVCYHVGSRDMPADAPATARDAWRVDIAQLMSDVTSWLSSGP